VDSVLGGVMTADFWGRLFCTGFLAALVGLVIFGLADIENDKMRKSEVGLSIGSFLCFLGVLAAIVSAFGYIWTTTGN
jgi:drug/metabolite transporter (DMT)-like permease